MTVIGLPSRYVTSAALHLHVIDEARLASARGGEDHELPRARRRGGEIMRLPHAEVIRLKAGTLERVEAGPLDAGKVRVPGAHARGGGLQGLVDLRRPRALGERQVLVARAHGEAVGIA